MKDFISPTPVTYKLLDKELARAIGKEKIDDSYRLQQYARWKYEMFSAYHLVAWIYINFRGFGAIRSYEMVENILTELLPKAREYLRKRTVK